MNRATRAIVIGVLMAVPTTASASAAGPAGLPIAVDAARDARVRDAIVTSVLERMGEDAEVDVLELQVTGEAPAVVRAVPEPDARTGRRIHFRLIGSGGAGEAARTSGAASAVITVRAEHARARTLITRGRDVADADVERSDEAIVGVPLRRIPRVDEVVGTRALVNLAPGEVVTRRAVVVARPAVKSGQVVRATARSGGIEVTASLVAAQDGAPGAIIKVVNKESRRELRARVVGSGTVEVIP